MRVKTIFAVFFGAMILVVMDGHAQKKKSEESYKRFKSRSSSPGDADLLLKEAGEMKSERPSEALTKVEEALGLSLAEGDSFNEGKSYLLLGEINEGIEEWTLALENYNRAYASFQEGFRETPEYKRVLCGLGISNMKLGNYDIALKSYTDALSLNMSPSERRSVELDLSEVYYQMGNYDEALKILNNIPESNKGSDPSFESRLQNQQAKTYAQLNDLDKTKGFYTNSLNTARSNRNVAKQDDASLQSTKEEIAGVFREQKRYDDEIDLRNQAVEYNLESNNLAEVTKDKVKIGKTLEAKGETTAALKEMEEAAAMSDTIDDAKARANAYLSLAELYATAGRTKQALSAYQKYSSSVKASESYNEVRLNERAGLLRQQKDIEELTKDVSIGQREEKIERATLERQELIIYGLSVIILIIGVTSYFIYRNAQASKIANQLLALKSLRSQMNPHFIFNALNSVNHFIAQEDERTANKFLSEFSLLMRLVMETSQEDFISLQKEQEILTLYLKLEHYRFRDKFDYTFEMDEMIKGDVIAVPPMLIQPYIENAVWHGLRYKEGKGNLVLRFKKEGDNLIAEIIDNGIGRKKSEAIKTEHQKKHHSTGIKNIHDRILIINRVYHSHYAVKIEDGLGGSGTHVTITLPITNQSSV